MAQYSQKGMIFLALLAAMAFVAYLVFFHGEVFFFLLQNLLLLILIVTFFVLVWKSDILKLKDYERAVIFRFGKLHRVGGPGWAIVLPFVETFTHVDLRTKTLDVERQAAITKDLIEVKLDAVIYLKVRKDRQSVINSVLEVEDFQTAARTFVVASIRDIVGGMELSEVISKIDKINQQLQIDLANIAGEWGVRVIAVQIKDLEIPETVLSAMHEEKAAVQQKLARIEKAKATKAEIDAVKEASRDLSDRTLNYYYIKALEEMSKGKSTKLIFPLQFSTLAQSIGNSLGGVRAGSPSRLLSAALEKKISEAVERAKRKKEKQNA